MALQKCKLNLNRRYQELQPHGTLDFPCAGYSSQYTDSTNDLIPWHWHQEIELIYLAVGNLKVQIPKKVFHLKQGESIFINSNILHSAEATPYCEIHSLVFHPLLITGTDHSVFAKKYITPLLHFSALPAYPFTLKCAWEQNTVSDIVTAFHAISSENLGYELVVREKLCKVCFSLYQQHVHSIDKHPANLNQDSIRIRKMLDFIHEHYFEHIDLAQIAKSADIGDRECLRCFQRMIKVSPMQYLIKYRITQGALILSENNTVSIADLSIQCGFDSPSHFSQMFKRFFKCTPREYRNLK